VRVGGFTDTRAASCQRAHGREDDEQGQNKSEFMTHIVSNESLKNDTDGQPKLVGGPAGKKIASGANENTSGILGAYQMMVEGI